MPCTVLFSLHLPLTALHFANNRRPTICGNSLPLIGLLPPGPAVLPVRGAPVMVVVRATAGMAAPVAGPAIAARRPPSRPLDRRDRRHPRRRRRSTRAMFSTFNLREVEVALSIF